MNPRPKEQLQKLLRAQAALCCFAPRAPTAGLLRRYLDVSRLSSPRIELKPARFNDPLARATGPARVGG